MQNKQLKRVVFYATAQVILTVAISAMLIFINHVMAYSALLGGGIAIVTSTWFALKVFAARDTNEPAAELRSFYLAEMNKIVLTGAMFVTVFVLVKPVNGAALLAVYFFVYITPLVVEVFLQPKRRRETKEN